VHCSVTLWKVSRMNRYFCHFETTSFRTL
jgi:hypothetical protein